MTRPHCVRRFVTGRGPCVRTADGGSAYDAGFTPIEELAFCDHRWRFRRSHLNVAFCVRQCERCYRVETRHRGLGGWPDER